MKYTKMTPCDTCPFLRDANFYLVPARAEEIAKSLRGGSGFPCHKTVDYEKQETDGGLGNKAIACAGALLVTERDCGPNQIQRIAARLGVYDPSKLDRAANVYDDFEEFIGSNEERHEKLCQKKRPNKKEKKK